MADGLPPLPPPKYIYHAPPLDGEDEIFLFAESGAVDEGCEHCERLYTREQVEAIRRETVEKCAKVSREHWNPGPVPDAILALLKDTPALDTTASKAGES